MAEKDRLTIEQVKIKLFRVHGDNLTLDELTYVDMRTRCRFIDKDFPNDEWWASPDSVISGKRNHPKRGVLICSQSRRYTIDEIKERVEKVHGNELTIDESTYVDMKTKCRFIDKDYGEKFDSPHNVINHKRRHKLRGFISRMKSLNKHTLKYNWETGEEVDCTAGYEPLVVDRWNEEKERFCWQIPFENKEENYFYFVDAYLPDKDIYIEIKRI